MLAGTRSYIRGVVVQESREGSVDLAPVRDDDTQSTPSTFEKEHDMAFSALLPPRRPSSAVMTTLDWQSWMRGQGFRAEAREHHRMNSPIRAQASILGGSNQADRW